MEEIGINGDLIHWVTSFLIDRKVQLVIEDNRGPYIGP
jgi:hypothetical protein